MTACDRLSRMIYAETESHPPSGLTSAFTESATSTARFAIGAPKTHSDLLPPFRFVHRKPLNISDGGCRPVEGQKFSHGLLQIFDDHVACHRQRVDLS
ncbi:hypothetical protein K239x_57380 [Planctomycetes bacterium K23_9]|uniref:Uncharacterized protein n=1 Tax=Stieleria marina TaxID=1930275 RepID=A0A517P2Z2_9BACT|nr:hypothetical protein K239x_57380 [Planctomycetes bacterium K23_9]